MANNLPTTFISKLQVGQRGEFEDTFAFKVRSNEGAFGYPIMTTTERDAVWPPISFPNTEWRGASIYNDTLGRIEFNTGLTWLTLDTGTASVAGFYDSVYASFPSDNSYLLSYGVGGGSFTNDYSSSLSYTGQTYLNAGNTAGIDGVGNFSISGWAKATDGLETPRGGNMGLLYKGTLNGTYGDDPLYLTASLFDGVAPTIGLTGFVDFNQGDARALQYPADNFKCDQTGTVKFLLKTGYTGTPAVNQTFFTAYNSSTSINNSIFIRHRSTGLLECRLYSGATASTTSVAGWSPVAGQTYVIEMCFDKTGSHRLFVDGVLVHTVSAVSGVRDISGVDRVIVGGYVTTGQVSNFLIKQLEMYDTELHTADYLPAFEYGYAVVSKKLDNDNEIALAVLDGKTNIRVASGGNWILAQETSSFFSADWQHLVVTFDGGEAVADRIKLYREGTNNALTITESLAPMTTPVTGANLLIARNGDTYFEGLIDEVALFNATLGPADVLTVYNGGAPTDLTATPLNASLINWWRNGDGDFFPIFTDNKGSSDITMTNMVPADIVSDAPAAGVGAPVTGSVYWNTTLGVIRTFISGSWVNLFPITGWDTPVTYYVDQIVVSGEELYRCTAQHTSTTSIEADIANWHLLTQHTMGELVDVDTTGAVEDDVLVLDNAGVYKPVAKGLFTTPLTVPVIAVDPATPAAGFVVLWADDNMTIKAKYETGEVVEMLKQYNVVDFLDVPLLDASTIDFNAVTYTTVVASLAADVKAVQIYDTAGINLGWYDAANTLLFVSGPGTNETTQVEIAAGTAIKVRPLEAGTSAFSGNYTVNFLG